MAISSKALKPSKDQEHLEYDRLSQTFYNSHPLYFFSRPGEKPYFIRYSPLEKLTPGGSFEELFDLLCSQADTFFSVYAKDRTLSLFHEKDNEKYKLHVSEREIITNPTTGLISQELYIFEQRFSEIKNPDKTRFLLFMIVLNSVKPIWNHFLPKKFRGSVGASVRFLEHPRAPIRFERGLDFLVYSFFTHLCEEMA